MATRNPISECSHVAHLKQALLKANTHQRHAEKLEYRKALQRDEQKGTNSIKNTDEEDRREQRVSSQWLKGYLRSKKQMLALRDALGLYAYFSVNLAKHTRPDTYDLGIDAQKIIDLFHLRFYHECEAEEAYRNRPREERLRKKREAGELM